MFVSGQSFRGVAALGISPVEIGAGRNNAIGLAVLTLSQELWVLKDRLMVMEALLNEHGLLDALDSYQPEGDAAARMTAERDRFLRSMTTILMTGKPPES